MPVPAGTYTQVAVGGDHACAVRTDGTLACWGDDESGQVMERPEFAHALWGMEFYDLGARKTVSAVNRERLFVPGSTTKLVSTGTALQLLGADHRFRTRVYRTGPIRNGTLEGDLVLVAAGDPNLSGREQEDGTYAFIDQDHSYGGQPLPTDPLTTPSAKTPWLAL